MSSLSRSFVLSLFLGLFLTAPRAEGAGPQTSQTPQDILARAKSYLETGTQPHDAAERRSETREWQAV